MGVMAKLKVLFIDDDDTLQLLASAMMNTGIFEIVSATRTAAADKILARQNVDIIVCDVMMPDEDGLKFCERLRASGNKTPVLILSAVSDPTIIGRANAIGITDYLFKPFDIHAFQKKLLAMGGKKPPPPKASSKASSKPSGLMGWLRG